MNGLPSLYRCLPAWAALLAAAILTLTPAAARAVAAKQGAVAVAGVHQALSPHDGRGATGVLLPRVAEHLTRGELRIVAFGSSSTQGIGASSSAFAYPAQLEEDLEALLPHTSVAVINQGVGGEDAVDMALRLPNVLAARPDLVIFQTGTNDPLRGVPIDRFVALTRKVIERLRTADIDVMLMEPQLCRVTKSVPASVLYRDAVRTLAAEMDVPIIRRWDLMQSWLSHDLVTPVQMLAPDGLHMADAGYTLLAKEVAREILADTR